MANSAWSRASAGNVATSVAAMIEAEGSGSSRFVCAKLPSLPNRDLADAVHYVCALHGRHPGVVDHAATRIAHPAARLWLLEAVAGFQLERTMLTRLVVAAGPVPSTPGQAESEAAVTGQRHALDMLAQSDRKGCAFGAAVALVLDWQVIRGVLATAAQRFHVELPGCTLPGVDATILTTGEVADAPGIERAIAFGAQQMLTQHRGLWDLLEARQLARHDW